MYSPANVGSGRFSVLGVLESRAFGDVLVAEDAERGGRVELVALPPLNDAAKHALEEHLRDSSISEAPVLRPIELAGADDRHFLVQAHDPSASGDTEIEDLLGVLCEVHRAASVHGDLHLSDFRRTARGWCLAHVGLCVVLDPWLPTAHVSLGPRDDVLVFARIVAGVLLQREVKRPELLTWAEHMLAEPPPSAEEARLLLWEWAATEHGRSATPASLATSLLRASSTVSLPVRLEAELGSRVRRPQARSSALGPGDVFADRYRILRPLGGGGMGEVYAAEHLVTGTRVALKSLRGLDVESIVRFKGEFRALAGVAHDYLVSLYELVVAEDGRWAFSMELIDGVDFFTYASDRPRLPAALTQLVEGVSALHARGIIHRDLKPANVLVSTEGRVVILDFGLATTAARPSDVSGTPRYMAPEQLEGLDLGPASDWYAVGLMVAQALTGRVPLADDPRRRKLVDVRLNEHAPDSSVPDDFEALCDGLLRANPKRRLEESSIRDLLGLTGRTVKTAFVGREAMLDALADRASGAVYVSGRSGFGKSTLVRHALERRVRRDPTTIVLNGRCLSQEASPYRGLDEAIDSLTDELIQGSVELPSGADWGVLVRLFPGLRRARAFASLPEAEVRPDDAVRSRAGAALGILLQTLNRPVVLVIDDAQWIGADCVPVLRGLMTRPEQRPLLVLCHRSEGASENPVLESVWSAAPLRETDPGVTRLSLGPLQPAEAKRVVRELLIDEARAAEIVAASAGEPFLLELLCRHVNAGGGDLADALRSRVTALPAAARDVLDVVSVANAGIDVDTALTVAESAQERLSVLTRLRNDTLVRERGSIIEPYHDRIRKAVVAELPRERLRSTHRALAIRFEQLGTVGPETLMVHFRGAGDRGAATRYATQAADAARRALAFDHAARLLETALELGTFSDAERAHRIEQQAECWQSAGQTGRAVEHFRRAAALAEPDRRARLLSIAGERLCLSGDLSEGLAVLETAVEGAGVRLGRSAPVSVSAIAWHTLLGRVRGDHFELRSASEIDPRVRARLEVALRAGISMAFLRPFAAAEIMTRVRRAVLDTGDPRLIAWILGGDLFFYGKTGRHDLARARVEQVADLAARSSDDFCELLAELFRVIQLHEATRFAEMPEALNRLWAVAKSTHEGKLEVAVAHVFGLNAMWHLGRINELRPAIDAALEETQSTGNGLLRLYERLLYAPLVALAANRPEEARAALAEGRQRVPSSAGRWQMWTWFEHIARIYIRLYEGDHGGMRAERLAHKIPLHAVGITTGAVDGLLSRCLDARVSIATSRNTTSKRKGKRLRSIARGVPARSDSDLARANSSLLEAGACYVTGQLDHTVNLSEKAEKYGTAAGCPVVTAAARRLRGRVLGGSEGRAMVDSVDTALRADGVVDPERFLRIYLPA